MNVHRKALVVMLLGVAALLGLWGVATAADAQDVDAAASPAIEEPTLLAAADDAAEISMPEADVTAETPDDIIPHWPLRGVAVKDALQQLGATYQKNIVPSKNVSGEMTVDLFNVTFREALDAIMKVNALDSIERGNFIYVFTQKEIQAIRNAERKIVCKTFTLSYARPEDVLELIQPCLDAEASVKTSPGSEDGIKQSDSTTGGMNFALNDKLVIRDYEENIKEVEALLAEIDKRPSQVLIEATILQATLEEDNALGIDFNVMSGVNFSAFGSTTPALTDLTTGSASVNVVSPGNAQTVRTDFNSAIPASDGGLTFGWLSSDVAVFLRALENVTDTVVLANPKLPVVNKQRGEILIGRRDGYRTTTVTETTATETVEFLETGTRLIVRPFIGRDGYVRLEIHPEDSSGSVVNDLPSEVTTECTTNVIVKDGHTIVVGGLFRESTVNARGQVPGVGNIPYVGALFRRTSDDTTREEVIILVTPRIIKQESDEIASEKLRDDISRVRLGVRQNLAWYGRARLAARHLDWAKQHLAAGNPDKALWDLNLALSLSPTMAEAQEYKEYITGEAIWVNEPRMSSARWIIQKMIMNELGLNVNEVIQPNKPLKAKYVDPAAQDGMGIDDTPQAPVLPGSAPAGLPDEINVPVSINVPNEINVPDTVTINVPDEVNVPDTVSVSEPDAVNVSDTVSTDVPDENVPDAVTANVTEEITVEAK